jgi:hypothetical protein
MKHNVYLFQCQYAIEVREINNYYLPYSIGCILAYAQQHTDIRDNFNFPELFFKREHPAEVVKRLDNPVVCGFSNYVWNEQYHLVLVKEIRKAYPKCKIIFGGPQVGQDNVDNGDCDVWIQQEGERNFVNALRDWKEFVIKTIYSGERIDDLDDLPSPYLTGVFDDIIEQHPDCLFSMTIETNRGCPFMCTFCDWGSLTYAKIKKHNLEKVISELDWSIRNPVGYIWVADANFGVFKTRDLAIAHMINYACEHKDSRIDAVNLQYYKNSTENAIEIAKVVGKKYNRGLTISVQSMTDEVLTAIKRDNMEMNDMSKLLAQTREADVLAYSEVILPLPLETCDSFKESLCRLLEFGQHTAMEMWKAQLLKNSEMSQPESIEKYGIESMTVEDYSYYHNPADWNGVHEKINIIKSTNTMTEQEVTEGFMYGWMIINLHTQGYIQILARYCREVLNVSYREFYDKVFNELAEGETIISDAFRFTKKFEEAYMELGRLATEEEMADWGGIEIYNLGGHFTAQMALSIVFQNKEDVYSIGEKVANSFGDIDPSIIEANRSSLACINRMSVGIHGTRTVKVNEEEWEQGYHIESAYDLETYEKKQTKYHVKPSIPLEVIKDAGKWHHRRLGFKNTFIKKAT